MAFLLALDQGTSSSRALLFDEEWRIVGRGQAPLPIETPKPGWVECDPEILWASQLSAARAALKGVDPRHVAGIGIASQRETVVLWDRQSGAPLGPAIVWQDRRTSGRCMQIKSEGQEGWLADKTGLLADPYFSATKLEWMLRGRRSGSLAAGTVDSWLIWRLTGGRVHATDPTNASRTLLLDLDDWTGWSEDLCRFFSVPREILPEIRPSCGSFGEADPALFGAPIPILGVAGDQQAALFGQCCHKAGEAKNTYGTGCFLLMSTGQSRPEPGGSLLATAAASPDGKPCFALEGAVFSAGAAIQWLRDGLGIIAQAHEVNALAASVPDSGDVWMVPAFTGLGAPDWDPSARGAIVGITRGTTKSHIARAALEGIAHQVADLVDAMNARSAAPMARLMVDGGASASSLLMQMQADLLGIPVVRPAETEATALGAAMLAAAALGRSLAQAEAAQGAATEFVPRSHHSEARKRWRQAVERCRGWAES